jgi:hypothetical protein
VRGLKSSQAVHTTHPMDAGFNWNQWSTVPQSNRRTNPLPYKRLLPKRYLQERQGWTEDIWKTIDLHSFGRRFFRNLSIGKRVQHMKFLHDLQSTGLRKQIISLHPTPELATCPCCKMAPETSFHILHCPQNATRSNAIKPMLVNLRKLPGNQYGNNRFASSTSLSARSGALGMLHFMIQQKPTCKDAKQFLTPRLQTYTATAGIFQWQTTIIWTSHCHNSFKVGQHTNADGFSVSKLPAQECSAKKKSNPRSIDSLFVYKSATISGKSLKHYNTVTSNSLMMMLAVAPEYATLRACNNFLQNS